MIGVLSLNPEGTILAARVQPERPELNGSPLSSLWSYDSADTAMLLAIAMKRDGFALEATVTTVDGFVEERKATFARTGRSEAPLCVTFSGPSKDTAPIPQSPPLQTGPRQDGGGLDDPNSRLISEVVHVPAPAVPTPTAPVSPAEPAENPTIDEALSAWINLLVADGNSKQETRRKKLCVAWFAETANWTHLSDITARSISDARCEMAGNSTKTVCNQLSRLRVFLDFCVAREWLSESPMKNIKTPKLIRGDGVRALSTEEVDRLLKHLPVYRWAYYMFAAWTGLRRIECERLCWKHVVLTEEDPRLELPASLTKSRVATTIPLIGLAVEALETLRSNKPVSPSGKVFERMPTLRTFNRDLERAGIPKLDERGRAAGIHSLRKHLATALANGGADIYTAQAMLRHADIQTTRNAYMDDRLLDLANKATAALDHSSFEADEDFDDTDDDPDDEPAIEGHAQPRGLRLVGE